jgi:hypothetical protein
LAVPLIYDFTGTNGDPVSSLYFKPDPVSWYGTTTYDASIYDNKLRMTMTGVNPSSSDDCVVDCAIAIRGDFDLRMEFSGVDFPTHNWCGAGFWLWFENNDFAICRPNYNTAAGVSFWGAYNDGSFHGGTISRINDYGGIRVIRSGTTVTFYGQDGAGVWTQISQYASATGVPVWPCIEMYDDGSGYPMQIDFDNFQIYSGVISFYIDAAAASLATSTSEAVLNVSTNVAATSPSLTTGTNGVLFGVAVEPPLKTLAVTTYLVNLPEIIPCSVESLTILANVADVNLDVSVAATSASASVSTNATDVNLDVTVSATSVSLTATPIKSVVPYYKYLTETSQIYDTLKWFWELTPADGGSTAAITDVAEAELGLNISEWLNVDETVVNNWTGTENVTSTLGLFGQSMIAQIFNDEVTSTAAAVEVVTYLHQMISIANSTFAAADTPSSQVTFNPTVAESIAVSGLLSAIHTLNLVISESGNIVDTLGFAWMDAIAETFAIVDAPTIQWVAMHILTESIVATDTAVGLFNFTDTVTETLAIAAALTLQQTLQDSIEEILNFGITIRLDDEVWECWVLNTNQFHPSVYSGFDFNSYAVYNNQAFGCREDGIYRLDGTTDNGTTINAGIVLPETDFGSMREKRFRKAYFGISGTSPSIRMETDTANVTYTITSSKANIQRNQKGKDWTLKVSGYDDMDFIELVPIILTR